MYTKHNIYYLQLYLLRRRKKTLLNLTIIEELKLKSGGFNFILLSKNHLEILENNAQRISKWFFDNSMKLNPDKCHLLIFGGNNTDVSVRIGETMVTKLIEENLLGVTLDKNLDF